MRFLGIDPDLHHTGLAIVEVGPTGQRSVAWVGIARVPLRFKGEAAVTAMSVSLRTSRDVMTDAGDNVAAWGAHAWHYAVVEGQEIYQGSAVKVSDLLNLAQVAGAAAGVFGATRIPRPKDWKGQVPKHIHQHRTCRALSWAAGLRGGKEPYVVPIFAGGAPAGADSLKDGDWKHVMDAIGLALWASENILTEKGCAA